MLDATTGQNALQQAKEFNEVTDITGIVLTKMDRTAKGGIAVAIQSRTWHSGKIYWSRRVHRRSAKI